MKKWNLIIDVARCEDCNNCFLSCKDEHVGNDFLPYAVAQPRHGHRWVDILRKERGQCPMIDVAYLPVFCMHCDRPPCVERGGGGAVYKRDDGIAIIDPVKARGRKDLAHACPYGSIWWNEEKEVPQKCTLCAHLLDSGWKAPRCVQACPTGALRIFRGDDAEMQQMVAVEKLEVLHPEFQTRPRVYYKNLYRFTRCFLGGSVAVAVDGRQECAEGARVTLFKNGERLDETVTDNYGDFKFDNLQENGGKFRLEIVLEGRQKKMVEVELEKSLNTGVFLL